MHFNLRHLTSVSSTMDAVRELAEAGAPEGTVIVADEQTAGRGRASHTWYSPPGQSLYASVLLRPDLAPAETGWITMVAALSVTQAIREIRDLRFEITDDASLISNLQSLTSNPQSPRAASDPQSPISIKWFNDIHIDGRKVCGILVESSITGDKLDYAVLGIGLNVNTRFDEAPPDVRARATSLREAWSAQEPLDRFEVLSRVLARFGERYTQLVTQRTSPAREYALLLETLGRDVRVDTGNSIVSGRALRIMEDGALIVLTADGEQRVGFGDITG